jgi:hypothetical protein
MDLTGSTSAERFQPVPGASADALVIARLNLTARRRALRIHHACHLLSDLALQCLTSRAGVVGAGHAGAMCIDLPDERVRQPLLHGFGPIEGHPERRAASAALLTHIQRRSPPRGAGAGRGWSRCGRIISALPVAVKHALPYTPSPATSRFFWGHVVSDDLQAELERLRAENELLKKSSRSKLAMKVSEKGALSVYGMGRFPVTLYKEQWLKLLGMGDEIKAFIEANNESLKSKE